MLNNKSASAYWSLSFKLTATERFSNTSLNIYILKVYEIHIQNEIQLQEHLLGVSSRISWNFVLS